MCWQVAGKTIDMNKIVDLSFYKSKFKVFFSITSAILVISYLLVYYGYTLIKNVQDSDQLKNLFMILLIGSAVFYSFWQQKKRRELVKIGDFSERLNAYRTIYLSRLYWHMLSGSVAAGIYFVTGRRLFLIFAVLDLITMMLVYPNKYVFKRELMDDEVEFIN